jgi:O-antigen/teichoic acid export membrane protein
MSLKRNIIANYASQLYVMTAGIVMVPLYIQYMGAEAYGLVGFFAMLQGWFNLLDMGLAPTMARASAQFRANAISLLDYRRLARALEGVFAVVALMGGVLLFTLAQPIAGRWLNASQLPSHEVIQAVELMAVLVALRWMCGLYRGVINGSERLVWLSSFNSLIATGRFVLILPVLMFVSASPQAFFSFQLGVAVLEIGGLAWMAYRLLPAIPDRQRIRLELAPLRHVLKFSLSIAFASSVWVLVTQTDKLVLSKILPLADYGYFTIAVLVASGIMSVSGPISSTIMPRMTRLHAEEQHDALIAVYRQATQFVSITAIPTSIVLIFFAPQVLWAWTGDPELVRMVAPVLSLYATGYAILAVSAFPYYLQYAKGNLRLHLIGNSLFVLVFIPSNVWATTHYGMIGAGWAWLISNALCFFLWTPLVHNKFVPGLHGDWLWSDIVRPITIPLLAAALMSQFMPWPEGRLSLALLLAATGGVFVLLAYLYAVRIHISKRGARFAS